MNIIDAVSICILVLFVLFGIYKGFISTLLNIGAYFVSVVLGFLLKPLGASAIKHSDRIFNMMLYYTEGSEFIANPEYVRMDISSLSTAEINDIIASSNLPFPMGREIAKNIAREAFADQGIVTLGDYFNQTIVGVFINILMFLVCFLIIRTILSLVINGADYADPFPMLKSHDGIFGGALGLLRGMLALLLVFMLVPIVLTMLGQFDLITNMWTTQPWPGCSISLICLSASRRKQSFEKVAKDHFFEFFSGFASHVRSWAAKPAEKKNLRFLSVLTHM